MIGTKLKIKPVLGVNLDAKQLQSIRERLKHWQKNRVKMSEKKQPLFKTSELLEELHVPSLSDIKAKNKNFTNSETHA